MDTSAPKDRFKTEYAQLNDAQKRAVDTIDGPVLVIAGPGTGKTQLLAVRVANILRKAAVLPQNILCLTFTESGQAAMRERLTRFIGPQAYEVTISTYHAFGNEIIRRYPEYEDGSIGQKPIDDLLLDEVMRGVLADVPYDNPLKNQAVYLRDLKSLISDAKRSLISPSDLRAVAAGNKQFIDSASELAQRHLGGLRSITKAAMPKFEQLLADLRALDVPAQPTANVTQLQLLAISTLETALANAEHDGKTTPLTKWKNEWLNKTGANTYSFDGTRTCRRLIAAADIYERYTKALEERSVFDYDDMIGRAVTALERNDDLKFTLQEQYQYILLDEFQDTNAAQFKLITLLTDNPVNEGRPNVLAVGDDDQAIYAFQGATYSNMRQFYDLFTGTTVIPLTNNYRSHAAILQTATNVAVQISERLHHTFSEIQKDLVAAGRGLPQDATIERHELPSDIAECAWVAREIKRLIDAGMEPSEIAVLAPKHKYLEQLVPYLNNLGVTMQYEKRENVLDDPYILEMTAMSRLVLALAAEDQAAADALWPQVLSFECWNIETRQIWEASWEARHNNVPWQTILMQSEGRLRIIGTFFTKLAMLSHSETLETMLDHITGRSSINLGGEAVEYFSPFYECYFGESIRRERAGDFWQTLAHLTVLRTKLREYKADDDTALKLGDFIAFVNAYQSANIKIMSTTLYREHTGAVQLMTAFKSKGLEFNVVFVISCLDEVWGSKARGNSSNITLPKNLQFIRYAGANEDERLRLFFVAITRARHHLYLTSHLSTYGGKLTTRLKYLMEQETEDKQLVSRILPEPHQLVLQTAGDTPDSTEELALSWQKRHLDSVAQPDLKQLVGDRLEQYQLTASNLLSFCNVMHAGPEAFFLSAILHFPQAQTIDGQYGSAIHATLEWLHKEQAREGMLPSADMAAEYFTNDLKRRRLSERDTELLTTRGVAALKQYVPQRSHTFQPEHRHEVRFKHEGVVVDGMHLSGTIDKLILNPADKTATVIDFKTGKAMSAWSNSEAKLHAYRQQLYFYKLLIENSATFRGYSVQTGILEFIEPDEDGNLQSLSLAFTAAEEQALRSLMAAVWDHIKQCDFPSISSYPNNLSGIKAFETDLREGRQKLL